MKATFLIGTREDYKRPGNPGSDQFRGVVMAACQERQVRFLAEEMSLEALSLFGATTSVCKQVADAMGITHCYCDPSSDEQRSLGIANPGKVSPGAFFPSCDYHEPNPEVREADAIREHRWLEHLMEVDLWPVLFVCGAHHTSSFKALLERNLVTVHVLFPGCGWVPN